MVSGVEAWLAVSPEDVSPLVVELAAADTAVLALDVEAPPGPSFTTAPHTAMNTTSVDTATVRRREATRWVRELGMHGKVAPDPERSLRIGQELPKSDPLTLGT